MRVLRSCRGRLTLTWLALFIAGGVVLAHGVDPHAEADDHLLVNPAALAAARPSAPGDGPGIAPSLTMGLGVALLGSILASLSTRAVAPRATGPRPVGLARGRAGPKGSSSAPGDTLRLCVQRC
ncbi:MAG: hypothetical protein HYU28_09110 [Actinobacteria bacterium]|nr:hypothetical protein [Actinomycetota bacterium]